jgi:hypothetical protein
LEDGLRNLIYGNKELLDKFVGIYTRGAKKYKG